MKDGRFWMHIIKNVQSMAITMGLIQNNVEFWRVLPTVRQTGLNPVAPSGWAFDSSTLLHVVQVRRIWYGRVGP